MNRIDDLYVFILFRSFLQGIAYVFERGTKIFSAVSSNEDRTAAFRKKRKLFSNIKVAICLKVFQSKEQCIYHGIADIEYRIPANSFAKQIVICLPGWRKMDVCH